jgi:hypothetical protein
MQMPLKAIEKNLKLWTEKGIFTADGAKAELESRRAAHEQAPVAAGRPPVRGTNYSQRDYDSQFLNGLMSDPAEGGEKP